jgi:preprotein translocase subunit SecE
MTEQGTQSEAAKSGFNIVEFARETRRETAKVTWPTRRETVMTTVMIVALALMAGFFFLIVDWLLGVGVTHILGLAG